MYKNYKIGNDGTPKYNGTSYKIAPERRFTGHTDEWKKRLEGKNSKLLRRRKKENTFSIKVIHLLYIIVFFVLIIIIGKENTTMPMNIIKPQEINITLNNAVRDFGNEYTKPIEGNQFLHIDLNFQNTSNDTKQMNMHEFILVDDTVQKINTLYCDYQSGYITKELMVNSNSIGRLTFELPLSYKGNLTLVHDNNNIANFTIE